MSTPNIADVIKTYRKLRDQKESIEAEVKERVVQIKTKLEKLEAYLKEQMDAQGLTSFKSPDGTAFLTTTDYANVANWDDTLGFIIENEAYDMLEKRVSKTAVRGYIDKHKAIPPGVTYGTKIEVNVRKPTKKVTE